ncbi:unannotated protein [freshwater metagenome]|uniref:Unannotated protein n=1 Tax=freshwater metagenome TaxID=449393 RepID=A0A6J6R3I0_9ZZZZ
MPMHANLVCNTHACNYNRAIVHYHMCLWQVRMPFFEGFPDTITATEANRPRIRVGKGDITTLLPVQPRGDGGTHGASHGLQ